MSEYNNTERVKLFKWTDRHGWSFIRTFDNLHECHAYLKKRGIPHPFDGYDIEPDKLAD